MTPYQLRTELQRLKAASDAALWNRDDERQQRELWRRAAAVRRQLAEATGEEHALWLDLGVQPECAVSGARLIQTESQCVLVFNARNDDGDQGKALLKFRKVVKTQFGLPNDEALEGHPLWGRGLEAYAIFEVLHSRWLVEEQARNQVRFPDFTLRCRHFIVTFHDSTFECLADDLSVSIDDRPWAEIWMELFSFVR